MSGAQEVRYEVDGAVATITIDRPKRRNALNELVLGQLIAAFQTAKSDDAVRVVVLTGAGDRAFSAGGDLAPGGAMGGGGVLAMHWGRGRFADALLAIRGLGKPVVARVNGAALGGGFGLLLACDLAVAADDVKIGCPEINVGLFPMMIMALIFRNVPRKLGVEMMLTGRRLTGQAAVDAGILNYAVPRAELDARVAELVGSLATKSPAILRLGLESFHAMSDMTMEQALSYLQSQLTLNTLTEDAAVGVMAFLQEKTPDWKGR